MTSLFASDSICIYLHNHGAVLETEWLSSSKGEPLRQSLRETLRLAQRYRVQGWIANHQRLGAIPTTDQDWIREYFVPAFVRLPLLRFGMVYSDNPLGRLSIHNITAPAQGQLGCEIQHFASVTEARKWVLETVAVR